MPSLQNRVRAPLQALVQLIGISRKNHNRQLRILFHQDLCDFITVHDRHIEVKHGKIHAVLASECNAGGSIGCDQNRVTFLA